MSTSASARIRPSADSVCPLRTVFLHVTPRCNLRCAYCYLPAGGRLRNELSSADLRLIWPDIVRLSANKLVITGGEPLLRADILELLRDLKQADAEHSVTRCLNTNGYRVTPALAEALVGLADEVRVSVDALQERNDAMRGTGSFKAAVRALDTLHRVGFEPKALITVTASGLPDLEELVRLLLEHKITGIRFNPLRPVGRGTEHQGWRVPPDEARSAIRKAWERCRPDATLPPEPEPQPNCGVGRFINILPNGDVYPCHVLTSPEFRCGNVREQSLVEMCRPDGLLAALAALDFKAFASEEPGLASLAIPGTCMGDVYAETRSCPAWSTRLPLAQA